jgi:hypothetical protein
MHTNGYAITWVDPLEVFNSSLVDEYIPAKSGEYTKGHKAEYYRAGRKISMKFIEI